MPRFSLVALALLVAWLVLAAFSSETQPTMKCHVVYLLADNDLDSYIAGDLEEIISNIAAVTSDFYYPIVYLDRVSTHSSGAAVTGLMDIDGITAAPYTDEARYIEKNFDTSKIQVVSYRGELNSDQSSTLKAFLSFAFPRCMQRSSSADIILTLNSHGYGFTGFGADYSHGSGGVRNSKIKSAIVDALAESGIPKLSMLGFDACSMHTFQVLNVFTDVTSWYLASENVEPGHGWDYSAIDPSVTVKDMAIHIIDNFVHGPHGRSYQLQDKTLGVVSTADFRIFKAAMDNLYKNMSQSLPQASCRRAIVAAQRATFEIPRMAGGALDLGDFFSKFKDAFGRSDCAEEGLAHAIDIAQSTYQDMLQGGHFAVGPASPTHVWTGMSFWFPDTGSDSAESYINDFKSGSGGFVQADDQPWLQFLETFFSYKFTLRGEAICNSPADCTLGDGCTNNACRTCATIAAGTCSKVDGCAWTGSACQTCSLLTTFGTRPEDCYACAGFAWNGSSCRPSTCIEAIDLSTISSPHLGNTDNQSNVLALPCGGAGPEQVFFYDLESTFSITIGLTWREFMYYSRQEFRWGGSCPGDHLLACSGDELESYSWTNDQAQSERIYFVVDAYFNSHGVSGSFTLSWTIDSNQACAENCQICTVAGIGRCDTCNSGFVVMLNKTCESCAANCGVCTIAGVGQCDSCNRGFIVDSSKLCAPCADNCNECTIAGAGKCDACEGGFLLTLNSTCVECFETEDCPSYEMCDSWSCQRVKVCDAGSCKPLYEMDTSGGVGCGDTALTHKDDCGFAALVLGLLPEVGSFTLQTDYGGYRDKYPPGCYWRPVGFVHWDFKQENYGICKSSDWNGETYCGTCEDHIGKNPACLCKASCYTFITSGACPMRCTWSTSEGCHVRCETHDDCPWGRFCKEAVCKPYQIAVGKLGAGIACGDSNTGSGFLMYSSESIHDRFSHTETSNAEHFVCVQHSGGWTYDDNTKWIAFTPRATDVLVAHVDFDSNTVSSFLGREGCFEQISQGYEIGDLSFFANLYHGNENDGEFTVQGRGFNPHEDLDGNMCKSLGTVALATWADTGDSECTNDPYTYNPNISCNGWVGLTTQECKQKCVSNALAANCPDGRSCLGGKVHNGHCHLYDSCNGQKSSEAVLFLNHELALTVTDAHPGKLSSAGSYFGFTNENADKIFGLDWHGKTFYVLAHGQAGTVMVWKDSPNCKMSCGRWHPHSNAGPGDWILGDVIALMLVPTPAPPPPTPAPATPPPSPTPPTACSWSSPHNGPSGQVLCEDGVYVTDWKCAAGGHGQRIQCPSAFPIMCSEKNCGGNLDYCCESDCFAHGGPRPCEATPGPTALPPTPAPTAAPPTTCVDVWTPGWASNPSPAEACLLWSENDDWGALQEGNTLVQSCSGVWACQYCAATCAQSCCQKQEATPPPSPPTPAPTALPPSPSAPTAPASPAPTTLPPTQAQTAPPPPITIDKCTRAGCCLASKVSTCGNDCVCTDSWYTDGTNAALLGKDKRAYCDFGNCAFDCLWCPPGSSLLSTAPMDFPTPAPSTVSPEPAFAPSPVPSPSPSSFPLPASFDAPAATNKRKARKTVRSTKRKRRKDVGGRKNKDKSNRKRARKRGKTE